MIRLWRTVNDIRPSANDPYYQGTGVLGNGTYFSPYPRDRVVFEENGLTFEGDPLNFCLITEFEIQPKNLLEINEENTAGLLDMMDLTFLDEELIGEFGKTIDAFDLGKLAAQKGYDAVLVTGSEDIDGGQQLLIPTKKKPPIRELSFNLVFKEKKDATKFAQEAKLKVKKAAYQGWSVEDIPLKLKSFTDKWLKEKYKEQVAATVVESAKGHFYHGTTSEFAEKILQEGFRADPERRVWDDKTSLESFPGTYFTTNLMTAISSAGRAVEKFGGVRAVFEVELEKLQGLFDEDEFPSPVRAMDKSSGFLINEFYAKRYLEDPNPEVQKYVTDAADFYLKELPISLFYKEDFFEFTPEQKAKLRPLVIEWIWAEIEQIAERGRNVQKKDYPYRRAQDQLIRALRGMPDIVERMNIRMLEDIGKQGDNRILSLTYLPNYNTRNAGEGGEPYVLKPVYGEPSADFLKQFDERIGGKRVMGDCAVGSVSDYELLEQRTASTGTVYLTFKRSADGKVFKVRVSDHGPSLEREPADLEFYGDPWDLDSITELLDKQEKPFSESYREMLAQHWKKLDEKKAHKKLGTEKKRERIKQDYPIVVDYNDWKNEGVFNVHEAQKNFDFKVSGNLYFFKTEADAEQAFKEFFTPSAEAAHQPGGDIGPAGNPNAPQVVPYVTHPMDDPFLSVDWEYEVEPRVEAEEEKTTFSERDEKDIYIDNYPGEGDTESDEGDVWPTKPQSRSKLESKLITTSASLTGSSRLAVNPLLTCSALTSKTCSTIESTSLMTSTVATKKCITLSSLNIATLSVSNKKLPEINPEGKDKSFNQRKAPYYYHLFQQAFDAQNATTWILNL